ncbi:hypothetical protein FRC08_014500 [Ceratobasidium sp. 394]|nr:hypothetical protein FRC08_014500 [Ceratobasidium sp. 394]
MLLYLDMPVGEDFCGIWALVEVRVPPAADVQWRMDPEHTDWSLCVAEAGVHAQEREKVSGTGVVYPVYTISAGGSGCDAPVGNGARLSLSRLLAVVGDGRWSAVSIRTGVGVNHDAYMG